MKTELIAIVGPSASGKTSLANKLADRLGKGQAVIISQDQYYKDWPNLPISKRKKINFDHPSSFDFQLLTQHLKFLKKGKSIKAPRYSFFQHKRLATPYTLDPTPYIIIEGLLILHTKSLRNMFDLKIYIDVDKATSLSRRIKRDLQHRGESVESVCGRYFKDVLPMQKRYVELQKKWADIVVDGSKRFEGKLNKLINKCNG